IRRMYQNDLVLNGRELGKIPDIDARQNWNYDMHDNSQWMFTRNRLLRSNGTAINQLHWLETQDGQFGLPTTTVELESAGVLDKWLENITNDPRAFPSEAAKTAADKPARAGARCHLAGLAADRT